MTSFELTIISQLKTMIRFAAILKATYTKYLAALLLLCPLFSVSQVDSAVELMSDTTAWENYEADAHVGGATEEEAEESALYYESSALVLFTVKDSLMHIPAYDEYCHWDTKNLFAQKFAQSTVESNSITFRMAHSDCDFAFPTADGSQTSPFGPRWGRMHSGLDLDLETGDNVYAAFEGMVRISQYHASYGNVVVVRHNNGLETLYAHMSQRKVKPGDHVEAGDLVGLGGNTGRSFGSHLHFEIRYLGEAIDPNIIIDPAKKSLRDWEFTLDKSHFEYAKIDPKALAARKGGSSKYHTVRSGETLSAIARKNKTSVSALCKLNKIKQTSVIRAGQKLKVK